MKRLSLAIAAMTLSLAACDNPKPRPDRSGYEPSPTPPAAAPAPADAPAPPAPDALSTGLTKRPEFPGFYLDAIGAAPDPMNKKPAITAAGVPTVLSGFGFDPVAKVPAKGVDVVVDGKAYGASYGGIRQDVATYFKNAGLAHVGYTVTVPGDALAKGAHTAQVRVIAADGKGYFESPVVPFTAN